MTVEHGKIEGGITVGHELTVHGIVTGDVTVVAGGVLALHGVCGGNLVIHKDAEAYLHGIVGGDARNLGGHLRVYGIVGGQVRTTHGGETFVDKNAILGTTAALGGVEHEDRFQGDSA
jgi:hypothetical protein